MVRRPILVRLACVRPAANVRSEPGSNSPIKPKSFLTIPSNFEGIETRSDSLLLDPKTHSRSACRARTHELFIHFVDLLFSFQRPTLQLLLCFNPVSTGVVILLLSFRPVKNFLLVFFPVRLAEPLLLLRSAVRLCTLLPPNRQELCFRSLRSVPPVRPTS